MDSWVTLPTLRSFGASIPSEMEQKAQSCGRQVHSPPPCLPSQRDPMPGGRAGPMVPVVMEPTTGSELMAPCMATSDTRYSVDGCKPVRLACLRVPSSVTCCASSSSRGL